MVRKLRRKPARGGAQKTRSPVHCHSGCPFLPPSYCERGICQWMRTVHASRLRTTRNRLLDYPQLRRRAL